MSQNTEYNMLANITAPQHIHFIWSNT